MTPENFPRVPCSRVLPNARTKTSNRHRCCFYTFLNGLFLKIVAKYISPKPTKSSAAAKKSNRSGAISKSTTKHDPTTNKKMSDMNPRFIRSGPFPASCHILGEDDVLEILIGAEFVQVAVEYRYGIPNKAISPLDPVISPQGTHDFGELLQRHSGT